MNQQFLDKITDKDFDIKVELAYPTDDTNLAAYNAKLQDYKTEMEALQADPEYPNLPDNIGCICGCIMNFIICMDTHPGQAGAQMCQAKYDNCAAACHGGIAE